MIAPIWSYQKCLQKKEVPWCWHRFMVAHFCINSPIHDYTVVSHIYRLQGDISTLPYIVWWSNQGVSISMLFVLFPAFKSLFFGSSLVVWQVTVNKPTTVPHSTRDYPFCFHTFSHAFLHTPSSSPFPNFRNYYIIFRSICFYHLHVNKNMKYLSVCIWFITCSISHLYTFFHTWHHIILSKDWIIFHVFSYNIFFIHSPLTSMWNNTMSWQTLGAAVSSIEQCSFHWIWTKE